MNTSVFIKAHALASSVHQNQEYGGLPYIFHPTRVANRLGAKLQRYHPYEDVLFIMTLGILHDVVEDALPIQLWAVEAEIVSMDDRLLPLVRALSRRAGVNYRDYIDTIEESGHLLRLVKLCDLYDHLIHSATLPASMKRRYESAYICLSGDTFWNRNDDLFRRKPPL